MDFRIKWTVKHGHYNLTDKSTREKNCRIQKWYSLQRQSAQIFFHTPISHHQILKRFHLDMKYMHERVVIAKTNIPFLNSCAIITHT